MSTTTQRPTPECDEDFFLARRVVDGEYHGLHDAITLALGQRLERERDEAREQIEAMREAIKALRRLRWIPLIERMPTEDDANDSHDVEWSNSGDIWQAHFTDSERATHWRPITLP